MSILSDKVAIVTGASSGIGRAAALALGKRSAKVVLAARRTDRIEALARQIIASGGSAVAVSCDVADRGQVEHVARTALNEFGRIDILINNAGVMPISPMASCRFDDWDRMVDVNIKGALYCIGCVLPTMLEQKTGHIVNVSSVAGRRTFPSAAVYCGTKFALHAISEGLRNELGEQSAKDGNRIRVTILAPGVVATDIGDSITDEKVRENMKKYYAAIADPLTGEDMADSILYALEAPPHVNVNELLIRPTAQVR